MIVENIQKIIERLELNEKQCALFYHS